MTTPPAQGVQHFVTTPNAHLDRALEDYGQLEDLIENPSRESTVGRQEECPYDNVVLVYAKDPDQLKVAYPNYSTNVEQFVTKVRQYLNAN